MRLFLHLRNAAGELTEDPEGQEFDTLDEARAEAAASAREIMADALRSDEPIEINSVIDIADERGEVLLTVTFRSAITW